ncbi:gliding motility lipoprotein GldH [Paludibacter sp. 221]|uniref:gliding motility lipoprotein GldH n=1 Tax=Paludibacter sp. 221 TaxID=2302939 RepID=UPI0013D39A9F|nr:gliding motility lipoprotein GldH [Paludibacter sp. 221]NDV45919.1 gliding motility lipoprotein GldH [Paludibacter sp. 221]
MKKLLFITLLAVALFSSCKNNNVYLSYHAVNPNGWNKDSIYTFEFDIVDTIASYNIYINVRNTPDYPYQNLWLFLSETQPDDAMSNDTIEFYLADHRGKWLGTGAGSTKEMPVIYKESIYFQKSGKYTFDITHGMRTEDLKGITDIGIRVEKLDEK